MSATVTGIHLGPGTHAARPAANAANQPLGSLYSCTDHNLIYITDGTTWTTYAALGGGAPAAHAASHENGGSDEIDATGLDGVSPGGGGSYDQVLPYPTSFSGDSEDMSVTTNWVDVDAFTAKTIAGGQYLWLQTVGPSKDDRVRKTLGTTKAGVFDFRLHNIAPMFHHWGASDDTYAEILLSTAAGAIIAIVRFHARTGGGVGLTHFKRVSVGAAGIVTTNTDMRVDAGDSCTLRITRTAGDLLGFEFGVGTAPAVLMPVLKQSNNTLYTPSSAGTVARIEASIHTPAGPGAAEHQCDLMIGALESL